MTRYWVVMSGDRDDNIWDIVEEYALVGIGWTEVGDLSGLDRDEIEERCRNIYPGQNAGRTASMLYRFAHEIEIGDVVITTIPPAAVVLIGRVTGDYTYTAPVDTEPQETRKLTHTRTVEWLRTDVSYDTYNGQYGIPYGRQTLWNADPYGPDIETIIEEEEPREFYDGGTRFSLERDLQDALRENIAQLEAGLQIVDGGREQVVDAGRIDITAMDAAGAIVIIELKAGDCTARQRHTIVGIHGGPSPTLSTWAFVAS